MGQPLSSKEKILRAARRLLSEVGHEQLSLRAVARAARFAPSSLYEHFPDRGSLLEAIAVESLASLRSEIEVACSSSESSVENILCAAMMYLRFAVERPHEFGLCFSRPRPAELVEPPMQSPLLPVVFELSRGLESGELIAPGDLTALDLALTLWTQTHGIAVLRLVYLSQTMNFEEKARQLLSATLSSWQAPGSHK